MRGLVPALPTPYPIGSMLPAVLQEDPVAMLLTEALDEVLAPAIAALDSLHAYLDPLLAPADFVEYLAGWVGVDLDENWPPDRRRAVVAAAVGLHRMRGTVAGLREFLELATGATVHVTDSGGATWSSSPDTPVPGGPAPRLTVRVELPPGVEISTATIEALVTAVKPVHVAHRVTVIAPDEP